MLLDESELDGIRNSTAYHKISLIRRPTRTARCLAPVNVLYLFEECWYTKVGIITKETDCVNNLFVIKTLICHN